MRFLYGDDVLFVCGHEAGYLGFTLYRELTAQNIKRVILAPTTILVAGGRKKVKTDNRDAAHIARCLAHHDYSSVHIPTEQDEQIKEFLRMRDDHKIALKKVKQQIIAFCIRYGYHYTGILNAYNHVFRIYHYFSAHTICRSSYALDFSLKQDSADFLAKDTRHRMESVIIGMASIHSITPLLSVKRVYWISFFGMLLSTPVCNVGHMFLRPQSFVLPQAVRSDSQFRSAPSLVSENCRCQRPRLSL